MRKRLTAALAVATLVLVPSAIAFASYTWTDVAGSGGSWYSLAVSDAGLVAYSSQPRLAAPFGGHVWKTTDGGASWTELTASPARANWMYVSTSGDGATVAGVGYATDTAPFGDIGISRDGGATWPFANTEANRQWTGLAMSRDGNTIVATARSTNGTNGVVAKSLDGGATWSDITPRDGSGESASRIHGAQWARVAVSSDGTRIVVGRESAGLYTSSNGGVTWTQTLNAATGLWPSISSSGDGKYVVASNDFYSSANNGVWVSSDYGMTWNQTHVGTGASPTAVARDGAIMAFAKYGEKIYVSRNNGATWSAENPGNSAWVGIGFNQSGERLIAVAENGLARFATSTTTTTTTTTTVAPSTSESTTSSTASSPSTVPASSSGTTAVTTAPATATTAAPSTTVASTTTAPSTTLATSTTSTVVDSPPPNVTPSMLSSFASKPLTKQSEVPAGGTFTVRIAGFQPFELVSVGFDVPTVQSQASSDGVRALASRKALLTVRADATGTISVETKAPATATGKVTLWAYGRESKVGFRQKLTIAALPDTGKDPSSLVVDAVALLGVGTLLVASRRRLRRSAMMG